MPKVLKLADIVGSGYGQFWTTRKRYRVVIGGRGSKKSTTAAIWFITHLMKYKGSNLLVIRKVFKDHRDSTFAQLKWAIHRLGVQHLWKQTTSPLEMTYIPTGQKVLFRGLDDPMSITSITVTEGYLCWVWFEEFFQVSSETDFNMIDMSIRGEVPPHLFKQITGTLNPWNEKHWIKGRFFDSPDENTFTLKTNYMCNEFLGDDDRRLFEIMKGSNPRRYNVEGLGNWGIAEGLIFDNWEELNFDYKELARQAEYQAVFGLDFGYTTDPTAFICVLLNLTRKELYIFDEHYQRGMLNNQIADMIMYKGYHREEIVADSSEPKSIEEIRRAGINRIKPSRKGKDSVSNGIQFIQQMKMYVHPNCTSTILELNNYAWDTKKKKTINQPIDDYNHLMDALRYALERFIGGPKKIAAVNSPY